MFRRSRRRHGRLDDQFDASVFGPDQGTRLTVRGHPLVAVRGIARVGNDVVVVARPEPTHLVVAPHGHLTIGDRVEIRHGVAIACHQRIVVGPDTVIGAFSMITDTDFHVAGDDVVAPEPKPIEIGARVRVGPHSVIMPGSIIGDDVTIAPASVVSGLVPAGSDIGGNPAVALRVDQRSGDEHPVVALVQAVFALPSVPDVHTVPADIEGWDSLGTLRLLVAFENEYGVTIDERVVADLATVGDWQQLLVAHRRRTADEMASN